MKRLEAGFVAGAAVGTLSSLILTVPTGQVSVATAPWFLAGAVMLAAAFGLAITAISRRRNSGLHRLEDALSRAAEGEDVTFPAEGEDSVAAIAAAAARILRSRDESRQALRENEQWLCDIAEAALEWYWETDAEHHFTRFSDIPGKTPQLDPRQLIGKRRIDLAEHRPEDAETWRRHEETLREHRPFRDFCYRLRDPKGELHYLRVNGKPIFAKDGVFCGYRGVSMEITAEMESEQRAAEARRLMMEALREARDAAELANQSKTRFLAAASHDLRQPLQALGLFVTTLAQRTLPDDLRHIVDRIESSLEALEHLLDTLLDISRLDAGVVEAHLTKFPVQNLFDRLALEFEPLAENQGLSMRFVATATLLRSDPTLLERILRNLLANAIRYTRKGGIVVGIRHSGGVPRLEVWDSGRGIPADQLSEIFREFHQLNGAREQRQGLGLGLAIVDRLAVLLGHRITVRSTPGRGSVFSVIFAPAAALPQAPPPRPAAAAASDPLTGRSVMVIDDSSIVRDGMQAVLEIWGCRVTVAEGLEQAESLLRGLDRLPDAIIADYRLRGAETGAAVIESLRRLSGQRIPALMITGDTSPERISQATAHGLPLLQKPVRPDRLRSTLLQVFSQSEPAAGE